MRDFLESWVRDSLPLSNRAPRTIESYEATVRLHLVPGLGKVRLRKLTPARVQRFLSDELAAGKGRRTVQLFHAVLRLALGQAEAWGLVPRNVAKLVEGPGGRAAERRPFTLAEQTKLLDAARSERLYPLIATGLATGLRLSELLGLRWEDVDLDAAVLRVRVQLSWRTGEAAPLKSRSSRRTVPLPPQLVQLLRDHQAQQEQEARDAPVWTDSGLVFCSRVDTPLSQRNVLRVWDRILARAGVEHRGFHHLRHTYGTALAERGVHERVAQELLGHADSRTTREIYTHTTERMHDEAIGAVADAFDEALGSPIGSPNRAQGQQESPLREAEGL